MSTFHRMYVDEAHFVNTAAECWWAAFRAHLEATHAWWSLDGGAIWVSTRAEVLAMRAHLTAHGIPAEAITVTAQCDEAGWNAEREAAGQTVIGGLA